MPKTSKHSNKRSNKVADNKCAHHPSVQAVLDRMQEIFNDVVLDPAFDPDEAVYRALRVIIVQGEALHPEWASFDAMTFARDNGLLDKPKAA